MVLLVFAVPSVYDTNKYPKKNHIHSSLLTTGSLISLCIPYTLPNIKTRRVSTSKSPVPASHSTLERCVTAPGGRSLSRGAL